MFLVFKPNFENGSFLNRQTILIPNPAIPNCPNPITATLNTILIDESNTNSFVWFPNIIRIPRTEKVTIRIISRSTKSCFFFFFEHFSLCVVIENFFFLIIEKPKFHTVIFRFIMQHSLLLCHKIRSCIWITTVPHRYYTTTFLSCQVLYRFLLWSY